MGLMSRGTFLAQQIPSGLGYSRCIHRKRELVMATIQRRVTRAGHVRYRAQVRIKNQPWVSPSCNFGLLFENWLNHLLSDAYSASANAAHLRHSAASNLAMRLFHWRV